MNEHASTHDGHAGGYETQELNFGVMMWVIPMSMLVLILYTAICWFGGTAALSREMIRKQTEGARAGAETLSAFRAQEDSSLAAYGREENGEKVQIPVERAMEVLAGEAAGSNSSGTP